ncbi:hypothetical protein B0T17DRAFT_509764 [Bombardia bombarda]|uniref:Uncharacterized protein n=1 Tax=Bombardia bombarda TaxID=252184 RepID=A0AA40BYI2_9PEZI|nr:hypothetical protein B0T17DRAFT_509764 [Bombardia bombarda]
MACQGSERQMFWQDRIAGFDGPLQVPLTWIGRNNQRSIQSAMESHKLAGKAKGSAIMSPVSTHYLIDLNSSSSYDSPRCKCLVNDLFWSQLHTEGEARRPPMRGTWVLVGPLNCIYPAVSQPSSQIVDRDLAPRHQWAERIHFPATPKDD